MTEDVRPFSGGRSRAWLAGLSVSLFCLIVGARWALYSHFGTDLPEWDQWDAEGLVIFYPLAIGQFHYLGGFWWPHNEHHVALTRIVAWALTELNGQWDQRLEATVNAVLPAATAILFLRLAAQRLSRFWLIGLFLLLSAVYVLPIASANTLSGFDSAQFFLIVLALGSIAALPFAEPYSRRWWGGIACIILSLGSLASGFFAAAVVAAMLAWQVWRRRRELASAAPALFVCAAAIAIGFMTRSVVPGHEPLKAQSIGDFFLTFVRAVGWPAFDSHWGYAALILFVPWVLVSVRMLDLRRRTSDGWNEFLSGMGLWVIFQVLATAYARGSGGPAPASRYIDTLVIGLIVNFLCLHSLWREPGSLQSARRFLPAMAGAWVLLCALGLAAASHWAWAYELRPLPTYHYYCEQNVRNYLITGDESYLRHEEIPYPSEPQLKRDLAYPGIAAILPVSVRKPDALAAATELSSGNGSFVQNDSRVPEPLNHSARSGQGLPAALPVLNNAITWGSFGGKVGGRAAHWQSQPVHLVSGRWLKFEVAGNIGEPGLALELRDFASGRVLAAVQPDKKPGNSWRAAYVHAPAGTFVIAARDESAGGWMAFSEPIEMGSGSYWAWQLGRHGGLITAAGGLLAIGLLAKIARKS